MYCTRTVGVKETYSTVDFYRSEFDRDTRRVQALFKVRLKDRCGSCVIVGSMFFFFSPSWRSLKSGLCYKWRMCSFLLYAIT